MSEIPDLSVNIFGRTLNNPTILASGVLGTTVDLLKKVDRSGAGAVTIKSISLEPREGHPNPTVLPYDSGLINAVGYSNPGAKQALKEFKTINQVECPVIGSIIGTCIEDFVKVTKEIDKIKFAALEVPLSCPHTPGFGKMGNQDNPDDVFRIVKAITENTSKPLFVKLPPIDNKLIEMAIAAQEAGAFGITAVNTVGPGMLIDIKSGKPYLGFGMGGISGPLLKPLAIAAIYQLYKAIKIPIIGTGGVSSGSDAIEMIMAGASVVGIGTAVYKRGITVFEEIVNEMKQICIKLGIKSLSDIRGLSHDV
ncbi:Dihydroorotate dehydrogenase, classes 1 and 2 [Candidatus Magnetomorum sp. HK-1]|nr:Dihydroorotate dehydrogenase, classes 1 and 2 [Candidatus Magnetomorum sp. HK-1]